MTVADTSALDSFLQKWRHRWPEWSVAETFVPAPRRDVVVAWFALLQEFEDAMNIAGDTLPADAKLAWWGEELRSWVQHRSRHPLGRLLEPVRAPWNGLAEALPDLIEARSHAVDGETASTRLQRYGHAVAAIEGVLLGRVATPDAVVTQLLAQRLSEGQAIVPDRVSDERGSPQVRAAHGLLSRWPDNAGGARERRMFARLARARLQRLARTGHPAEAPSRMRLLFTVWRAARGG